MTTVLEKLKALDAQRAQLLEDAKKEALDNAEKAVAELNELGFHYTLTEGASTSTSTPRAPRKASSSSSSKAPSERPSLPYLPFQNDPSSRWANAPVTEDQKAIHGRGTYGKASGEGWVVSSFADAYHGHRWLGSTCLRRQIRTVDLRPFDREPQFYLFQLNCWARQPTDLRQISKIEPSPFPLRRHSAADRGVAATAAHVNSVTSSICHGPRPRARGRPKRIDRPRRRLNDISVLS